MTWSGKHLLAAIGLAGTVALGGCGYDDGYYGGMSVGAGYYGGGYYDGYWDRGYYPSAYYGWYDGFYYPGTGYYVYDRGGRRHRWNDGQRHYWEGRRGNRDGRPAWSVPNRGNWSGWRDRDRNAAPANPPVVRERGTRDRPAWSAPRSNGDARSSDDRRRGWRR